MSLQAQRIKYISLGLEALLKRCRWGGEGRGGLFVVA